MCKTYDPDIVLVQPLFLNCTTVKILKTKEDNYEVAMDVYTYHKHSPFSCLVLLFDTSISFVAIEI